MKCRLKAAFSAVLACVMSFSAVNAQAAESDLLYEKVESQTLTSGVVYKEINRLYKMGWMDIYVLELDASDPNVGLKVLESATELGGKHTVSDFAKTYKVKAAVNGDFFGSGTPLSSMGQVVRNGRMEAVQNYYNGDKNNYAGFFIDSDGTPFIDYVKSSIGFYNSNETVIEMGAKNKFTDFSKPVYFDREAISSTAGIDKHRSDLAKIVVSEGAIVDISGAGETVEVPENGYIIVMNKATAAAKMAAFSIGQKVSFNENNSFVFRPEKSISAVNLGLSGGGELLRNGEIVSNGLIVGVNTRNPRTMVGVNKAKTKIYVVCVDGRGSSKGATHTEAAELMASLGCYDAIHYDGGGSTTMVVEDKNENLSVTNNPSEGSERKVANALGVASVGESTGLASLELSVDNEDNILFNGFGSKINVTGLDNNLNKTAITQPVIYSASLDGKWENNTFIPSEQGDCIITATAGNAEGKLKVRVLEGAAGLTISMGSGSLDIGESTAVSANVINKDGFEIAADSSAVNWSVNNEEVAYIQNGRLYGKGNGKAVVTAECNGATASMNITVGRQYVSVMSFEARRSLSTEISGDGVKGNATQVNGVAYDGNRSVSVEYGFKENMATTQSVFVKLAKPVLLPAGTRNISFWYKGGNGGLLKAIITDTNDNSYGLTIDSNLSGKDWQKAEVNVPDAAVFPIEIEKFCIEALNTTSAVSGTVYIDNIGVSIGGMASAVKQGFKDPAEGDLSSINGEEISVFGQTKTGSKGTTFNQLLENMRDNARLTVFVGASDVSGDVVWQNKYETQETNNFSIINLASSAGTLTADGSEQLRYLRSYLENMSRNNVIINMDKNLLNNGIKDSRESEAIIDILKTAALEKNKNIIVVSATGTESSVLVKDGIRYVNLAGLNELNPVYLRVKGNADSLRYELR